MTEAQKTLVGIAAGLAVGIGTTMLAKPAGLTFTDGYRTTLTCAQQGNNTPGSLQRCIAQVYVARTGKPWMLEV